MSRPPEFDRIAVLMPSCDRYASLWPLSLPALPFVRRKLARMFDYRHDVTKRACEEGR